jgi:G:T-mismatch repair DNA endonuclease (very short patch repair protein)
MHKILELKQKGWHVIVIWQCEIKNLVLRNNRMEKLYKELKEELSDPFHS